jgi:integral membrane protein (TIGR00529 family)
MKYHFGLSLFIGSILLGLFSLGRIQLMDIGKAITRALLYDVDTGILSFQTMELALLMILIFMLAKTMKEIGAIDEIVSSLKTIFSHSVTIGLIPAIYGLMPVPGGALFSAPMVDKEGKILGLKKDQRNFINVWFRHIWFPIYPISSAMILICSKDFTGLSYDIELYNLIAANILSFLLFIFIGFIFIKKFLIGNHGKKDHQPKQYSGLLFLLVPTMPIIFYIFLYGISLVYPFISVPNYQNTVFIIGLLFSFILLFFLSKLNSIEYYRILKKDFSFNIAFTIFGIIILREMFDTTNVNIILAEIIQTLPFPPIFIIILIPTILGIITGYNLGAIALSYVVIQPLFLYTDISIIGLTSIIFMSSFVGYLISPIHLCNVVSSDHFKTDTTRMYRMYLPSVLIILIIQTFYVYIFYRI